ncbi:hypothetical protein DCD74_12290 [Lysobacter oculi]|uniref:Uncharacterized protein n=1 Tax=Solilutibacter oculi TaxID=2698682 RepID=A0A344J8I1_9GAMM|nr:hypothetical protein [Lysobacter oculi]AXA85341.1 hypothetical protein DCD74_12290 [Lysobacter oculi]
MAQFYRRIAQCGDAQPADLRAFPASAWAEADVGAHAHQTRGHRHVAQLLVEAEAEAASTH